MCKKCGKLTMHDCNKQLVHLPEVLVLCIPLIILHLCMFAGPVHTTESPNWGEAYLGALDRQISYILHEYYFMKINMFHRFSESYIIDCGGGFQEFLVQALCECTHIHKHTYITFAYSF